MLDDIGMGQGGAVKPVGARQSYVTTQNRGIATWVPAPRRPGRCGAMVVPGTTTPPDPGGPDGVAATGKRPAWNFACMYVSS